MSHSKANFVCGRATQLRSEKQQRQFEKRTKKRALESLSSHKAQDKHGYETEQNQKAVKSKFHLI